MVEDLSGFLALDFTRIGLLVRFPTISLWLVHMMWLSRRIRPGYS